MLPLVSLVEQWAGIVARLPGEWAQARLRLTVDSAESAERAAALLGPANPSVRGRELRLYAARGGPGAGAESLRRLFGILDREGIDARLELLGTGSATARAATPPSFLAAGWDDAIGELPEDWSDVYAQVDLNSSDQLPRAALLLAPVNPATFGVGNGFRFRCARRTGYGVSPQMARRCLARLDEEAIRGDVHLVHALSDTRHVATQGPVWYLGGRSV
jgi:hypothetical protein